MKNFYITIFFIIFFTNVTFSQIPKLEKINCDTLTMIGDLKVDKNMNLYFISLVFVNNVDFWYITKLNKSYNVIWRKSVYSNEDTRPQSFEIDDSLNIFITGYSSEGLINLKLDSNGIQKWLNIETIPGYFNRRGEKILIDKSGFIYVGGEIQKFLNDTDILLLKYDSNGKKIWQRIFNSSISSINANNNFTNMLLDDDNNIYISGSINSVSGSPPGTTSSFLKYNSNGDLIFHKEYSNFFSGAGLEMVITQEKKIYLCGELKEKNYYDNSKILLIKYDTSGNFIWERRFTKQFGFNNYVFRLIKNSSDNIYIGGVSEKGEKIHPNLTIWESYLMLLKYNSDGNIAWTKFISGDTNLRRVSFYSLKTDYENNVYFSGTIYNKITNFDVRILKLNNNGNNIWDLNFNYKDSSSEIGGALYLYPNNNFLVVSRVGNLNKICYLQYSQITNISNNSIEIPNFKLSQNYPNPFNSSTNINFEIYDRGIYFLKIYDVLGKIIFEKSYNNLNPGVYEFKLQLNNHNSGIYYYELSSENKKEGKKMILIK